MQALFEGLSAFPLTPADPAGRIDTDALCRLLTRLTDAKVHSVGLLGSTGTYAYLTRTQRQHAVEAAAECIDAQIPLIVGVGALRTDEAVALARDAERAGADALLLAPVSYTPLTEEEVYQHYQAVAVAPALPLCIYNNPGTTHFRFSMTLLQRLSEVPNIQAVKMPLPENSRFTSELQQLRERLPADFLIGYSGDWGCAEGILSGADSWYSVVGGLLPVPTLQLVQAARSGDVVETQRIEAYFQPLWALFKELGSLRVVYASAQILGLTIRVPPRPILPVSVNDFQRVELALDALNALDH